MLDVGTHPVPRSSWRASTASSSAGTAPDRRQVRRPVDPGRPQVGQRGPVRLADGGVAAGQRDRLEVPDPLEAVVAGDEDLAAPDGAVRAEAGAVEGEADDAAGPRARRVRP